MIFLEQCPYFYFWDCLFNKLYPSKSLSQVWLSEGTQTRTSGFLEPRKLPFKLGFEDWITQQLDRNKGNILSKWGVDNPWHVSASHFSGLLVVLGWNEIEVEDTVLITLVVFNALSLYQQHLYHVGSYCLQIIASCSKLLK